MKIATIVTVIGALASSVRPAWAQTPHAVEPTLVPVVSSEAASNQPEQAAFMQAVDANKVDARVVPPAPQPDPDALQRLSELYDVARKAVGAEHVLLIRDGRPQPTRPTQSPC
ncbi:MAG: hypothetical protein JWN04_1416 [Myxococcaceae bacterium]|nr:hypothetical protein [Myxococcaceae bacterium]